MRKLAAVGFAVLVTAVPVASAQLPKGPAEVVEGDWLARVQAGIRDQEYLFTLGPATYRPERGEVWQAPNRALDLRLYLDDKGMEVKERPVYPIDLLGSIYQLAGIDAGARLPHPLCL